MAVAADMEWSIFQTNNMKPIYENHLDQNSTEVFQPWIEENYRCMNLIQWASNQCRSVVISIFWTIADHTNMRMDYMWDWGACSLVGMWWRMDQQRKFCSSIYPGSPGVASCWTFPRSTRSGCFQKDSTVSRKSDRKMWCRERSIFRCCPDRE